MVRFLIKQSVLVNVITVLVLGGGLFAYLSLTRENFPETSPNYITISTVYAGVSAEEIEKQVTIPLEDEISDLDGIENITSTSTRGLSRITLELDEKDRDIDMIYVDVQTTVNSFRDLPDDAEDPVVRKIKFERPIIDIALMGEMDDISLKHIAEDLEDEVKNIDGVGNVQLLGIREREYRIEPIPGQMYEQGVAFTDIIRAVRSYHRVIPGGKMATPGGEYILKIQGEIDSPKLLESIPIRQLSSGGVVRVGDVARVLDDFEEAVSVSRVNGKKAITLKIQKKREGDTLKIVDEVYELVERYRGYLPDGVTITTLNDFSHFLRRRINIMHKNALIGFAIVMILLYILLEGRIALVTALGIPFSLALTAIVMQYVGLTANLITIFSFIVVLGMLVDDAIIVAENCHRHIESGMGKVRGVVVGVGEVFFPVLAAILTTLSAFLPLTMMTGQMGKMMKFIPWVVSIALLASLLESFLILPSHIVDFLPGDKEKKREEEEEEESSPPWYLKPFLVPMILFRVILLLLLRIERFFNGISRKIRGFFGKSPMRGYEKVLNAVLDYRYIFLIVMFGFFIFSLWFQKHFLRFELFNPKEVPMLIVNLEAPENTSASQMDEIMMKYERAILDAGLEEYYDGFVSVSGYQRNNRGLSKSGSNLGQIWFDLRGIALMEDEVVGMIRKLVEKLDGIPDAVVEIQRFHGGPPTGSPVSLRIYGRDFSTLEELSEHYKQFLSGKRGVYSIKDNFEEGKEKIVLDIDRNRLAFYGITLLEIQNEIQAAVAGIEIASLRKGEEEIKITARLPETRRRFLNQVESLYIPTTSPAVPLGMVPLRELAKFYFEPDKGAIHRYDRSRYIEVNAEMDKQVGNAFQTNQEVLSEFERIKNGYPGYRVVLGGEGEESAKSLDSLKRAALLGIALIYIILVSLFNSAIQPLIVMSVIPFSLVGVIFGTYIEGEILSLVSLIGAVALCGIVVNDSLVLVDFINSARSQGLTRRESILAGAKVRLRPIFLTSVTTIGGLFPLAQGIGGTESILQPMAIAMVWGLTFSTVVTILVVPALYAVLDDFGQLAAYLKRRS